MSDAQKNGQSDLTENKEFKKNESSLRNYATVRKFYPFDSFQKAMLQIYLISVAVAKNTRHKVLYVYICTVRLIADH